MDRGVDLVIQNGVPLPILIGIKSHDRMSHICATIPASPATTTVLSVVAAADFGIRTVAVVNKWTEEMNRSLGNFSRAAACGSSAPPPARCIRQTFPHSADDHVGPCL